MKNGGFIDAKKFKIGYIEPIRTILKSAFSYVTPGAPLEGGPGGPRTRE